MKIYRTMLLLAVLVMCCIVRETVASAAIDTAADSAGNSINLSVKNSNAAIFAAPIGAYPPPNRAQLGCPLCDSSVYSYCSNRAVHDGCCCNGGRPPLGYGYPCPLGANCNYLHANSCYEHRLIVNCCCNRP